MQHKIRSKNTPEGRFEQRQGHFPIEFNRISANITSAQFRVRVRICLQESFYQ